MSRRPKKSVKRSPNGVSPEKRAQLSGIVPIKRQLDPVSFEPIIRARGLLRPETGNAARYYMTRDLGATVIGFSRIKNSEQDILEAPPTREIIKAVESCREPLEVELAEIDMFGGRNFKLGFHTIGLDNEVALFEEAYRAKGFELGPTCHPDALEEGEEPKSSNHLTIGTLHQQIAAAFRSREGEPGLDRHYNAILKPLGDMSIILQGVEPPFR